MSFDQFESGPIVGLSHLIINFEEKLGWTKSEFACICFTWLTLLHILYWTKSWTPRTTASYFDVSCSNVTHRIGFIRIKVLIDVRHSCSKLLQLKIDQKSWSSLEDSLNLEVQTREFHMPSNLVENGYLLSWFQNSEMSQNSFACKKTCNESGLYMFGLDDFYHFSQQLVKRNFSIHENVTKTNEFINFCTDVEFDFATRTWIGWIPEIAQFWNFWQVIYWISFTEFSFFLN